MYHKQFENHIKLLVLTSVLISYVQLVVGDTISFNRIQKYAISLSEFREIKSSEVDYNLNNAYSFLVGNEEQRTAYNSNSNNQFIQEVNETWHLAFEAEDAHLNGGSVYSTVNLGVTSAFFPFLVCVSSTNDEKQSGYKRMQKLSQRFMDISHEGVGTSVDEWSDFGVHDKSTAGTNSAVYPMYNTADKSCFGFNSLASEAKETAAYSGADKSEDDFFIIPFTFSMKLESGTIEEIERRLGNFQQNSDDSNIFKSYTALEKMKVKLGVQFSPGTADGTKDAADWNAEKIITVSRALANGYYENYLNNGGNRNLSNLRKVSINKQDKESDSLDDEYLESILKMYSVSYKESGDDWSSRKLKDMIKMNGPCDDALQHILYESYSLGHSFDAEISFTSSDQTTKQCILTFVRALAQQPEVLSVAAIPVFQTFNDVASQILLNSGISNDGSSSNPFHDIGYNGEGQVVAVSDTGVDQESCYFYDVTGPVPTNGYIDQSKRKVVQYLIGGGNDNDSIGGHGTHVAGTILGEKSIDGVNGEDDKGNGIAPKAKLAFVDIGSGGAALNPNSDMNLLLEPGRIAGANIHSASWGAGSNFGAYTYYCTRFDEYLYLNQEFLVTMAAGNSGSWGISWPATAKNVVTVGATVNSPDSKGTLASFSSRGSVDGNRIKPDVVAPGASLNSAYGGSSCSLLSMAGTSMATPTVAGVSAIIRQYLIEKGYKPSGSLVKSLLTNGAQAIETGSPFDGKQGFGLVDLIETLPLEGHNNFNLLCQNLESVSEGGTNTIELSIDTRSGSCDVPLSVTMAYTDPAGASIMNNIDLEVENDAGDIIYPNGLDEADNYNIVERVRIDDVQNNENYIIRIIGTNLIQSSILYSLSVTGCFQVSSTNFEQSDNTFVIKPKSNSGFVENLESIDNPNIDNIEAQKFSTEPTEPIADDASADKKSEKQDKNNNSEYAGGATEKKYYSNYSESTSVPISAPSYNGGKRKVSIVKSAGNTADKADKEKHHH